MRWSNRSLWAGALLIVATFLVAIFPPPQDPSALLDPSASRLRPPLTQLQELQLANGRSLLADGVTVSGDTAELEIADRRRTLSLSELADSEADPPSRLYLLGTDHLGRDVFSRIVVGARTSLLIALLSVCLALVIGITLGALAAMTPHLDGLVMRFVDGAMSFPQLFLVIALAAIFAPSTTLTVVLLGSTSWMVISRLTRAELLHLRTRDFVLASRALGQHPLRILLRHLLPNALTPIIAAATMLLGDVILTEAALSFFGLGIQPPTPSLGNMINDGRNVLGTAWWLSLFPGLTIAIAVIGFNLLGDGLQLRLNPAHRGDR